MFVFTLESYIEYDGRLLHGVYTTKKLAREAEEYLRGIEFDTQRYIITKVILDKINDPYD